MTTPLLEVSHLKKTIILHILGGKQVRPLVDVSFELAEGTLLGVVGPSGAGKSSLLKCIYRTYLTESGAIWYRGVDGGRIDLASADERTVIELRRREIRYVSQFLKAPPRVPAVDVVAMPMLANGMEPAQARARAAAILTRLQIGPDLQSSYPSLFSGGEQQRVNVARALVDPPRLLLLDEPTSALDVENQARVLELLEETRAAGTTMVGVFHDLDVLARLADHVIVLDQGVVTQAGTLDEVNIWANAESTATSR